MNVSCTHWRAQTEKERINKTQRYAGCVWCVRPWIHPCQHKYENALQLCIRIETHFWPSHPTSNTFRVVCVCVRYATLLAKYCRSGRRLPHFYCSPIDFRYSFVLCDSVVSFRFEIRMPFAPFGFVFIQIKYRWDDSKRFHSKCSTHSTLENGILRLSGKYFQQTENGWKKHLWSSCSLLFISAVKVRQISCGIPASVEPAINPRNRLTAETLDASPAHCQQMLSTFDLSSFDECHSFCWQKKCSSFFRWNCSHFN